MGAINRIARRRCRRLLLILVGIAVVGGAAVAPAQAASAPPKFNVPGAAIVNRSYSFTVASVGSPAAKWRVYDNKVSHNVEHPTPVTPTVASNGDTVYKLNDGLVFDSTTGVISAASVDLTKTDEIPDSFILIANNLVGGAEASDPDADPPVITHDVRQTIQIPVLFSDVPVTSDFADAIYQLAANGTINGYGDGSYSPTNPVSRQAFAHLAAGLLNAGKFSVPTGECTGTQTSGFSDVPKTSPFCREIAALASMGVVTGYRNGTFRPQLTVARQGEAAFLYRVDEVYQKINPKTGGDAACKKPAPFSDVTSSNPFCGDIEWMVDAEITAGYSDGTFRPTQGTSRQGSAQFVYNTGLYEGD